jgi:acetoacetate decarboxylase
MSFLRPSKSLIEKATKSIVNRGKLPGKITKQNILNELPSTPVQSPSYPRGPYFFRNREFFIVSYQSDPYSIRELIPEPLVPNKENIVLYEWINMPSSTGFGSYSESGIVIPCFYNDQPINFTLQMYLDIEPPIACGREIWGFGKKHGNPKMECIIYNKKTI